MPGSLALCLFANRWNAMFGTSSFLVYQWHWKSYSYSEMTPVLNRALKYNRWHKLRRQGPVSFQRTNALENTFHDSLRWKKMIVISKHRQRPGTSSIYVILSSTWYTLLLFKNSFSFFILRQIAVIVLYIRNVHSEKRVTFWDGREKKKN